MSFGASQDGDNDECTNKEDIEEDEQDSHDVRSGTSDSEL